MIAISSLNKQYGSKVLYRNASLQIKPGEKIGLVGANGAGKTSIFRILVGEEGYDSGTVSKPESWVVGYFSQDVGEMKGRSALEEVMVGAGRVSRLAQELQSIEKRLGELSENPGDGSEMEKILERFGEVQLEFEQRGGYDLEARA
ncbi:MAG: ATP-binding cassette domain-containing protein, partial [Bdellovibrionales bacterium]|nr:ATP-binding cassette domain-containing protein [Bdellovibrionales bacterium]